MRNSRENYCTINQAVRLSRYPLYTIQKWIVEGKIEWYKEQGIYKISINSLRDFACDNRDYNRCYVFIWDHVYENAII